MADDTILRANIDFETRAVVDLKKTGVYPYAKDKFTGLWCMAWSIGDGEVQMWRPGMPFPSDLMDAAMEPNVEFRAWNANFERILWKYNAVHRNGFPQLPDAIWVDTAAEAAAMALPRSLDQCAAVCKVKHQKDKDGYALMMRMTRPRKWDPETMPEPVWWTEPEKIQRLEAYCMQDVRAERDLMNALHRLTPDERRTFLLDQKINDRGVRIDVPLVVAAMAVVEEGVARADAALDEITGGYVSAATQVGRLKEWMVDQGHPEARDSLDKAAIRELLESDLDPGVRQVLTIRAAAGRTSTGKLRSMLNAADGQDHRARGMFLYHAAGTGRWSGRGVQPHNLPKGEDVPNVEQYIPDMLQKAYDTIDLFLNPIEAVSAMLRAMMIAREGHDFVGADFSAIEARVLNWIAGQDDITALFAAGEDVYVHNAMRMYGLKKHEVQKFPHRHTGKFAELAMGYQMGAKTAVIQGKDTYKIELTEEQAKEIVDGYRAGHPHVVQFWKDSNNAAKLAVREPGRVVVFGPLRNLKFVKRGQYLYLILPSKRALVYADPRMEKVKTPWIVDEEKQSGMASDPNEWPEAVVVWGAEQGKWIKYALYGGIIVENIVQALARDILRDAMFRLEDAGYPVVLHVHDEIVTEVPEAFGSVAEVEAIMRVLPAWAAGCPINAEGWRGKRYRK